MPEEKDFRKKADAAFEDLKRRPLTEARKKGHNFDAAQRFF
jgi:hypothetical protein